MAQQQGRVQPNPTDETISLGALQIRFLVTGLIRNFDAHPIIGLRSSLLCAQKKLRETTRSSSFIKRASELVNQVLDIAWSLGFLFLRRCRGSQSTRVKQASSANVMDDEPPSGIPAPQ